MDPWVNIPHGEILAMSLSERGSQPVFLQTAKESLNPSDPGKWAALFLFDVVIVSLSWTGGLFFCRM